jgi:hypothetical protein
MNEEISSSAKHPANRVQNSTRAWPPFFPQAELTMNYLLRDLT